MTDVDITPPSNVYATFGRLNYTPWHAIAEFVDNATQDYYDHVEELAAALGRRPRLTVSIEHLHKGRDLKPSLVVADNAHGMGLDELERALRLNAPPPDTSGRSEFGMGLKTAACWFGRLWRISTSRLGDPYRHEVTFDVDRIAESGARSVSVLTRDADPLEHGTVLTIERMARPIVGRQVKKTQQFLAGIYRRDLQRADLRLRWNNEPLKFEAPLLYEWDPDGSGYPRPARVEIDTLVVDPVTNVKHHVTGWVGALERMSAVDSGLVLLRRERMIIGGSESGWKPIELVGSLNSHSGKRITGELNLDSFPVNFTKDGFAWDGGLEEDLIETLAPLVAGIKDFAANARVTRKGCPQPLDFVRAVDEVQQGVDQPVYVEAMSGARQPSVHVVSPTSVGDSRPILPAREVPKELVVPMGGNSVRARLELVEGGPQESWLSVSRGEGEEPLRVVLNTGNRFVSQHLANEQERTLVTKFALAVAIAEEQARRVFGDDEVPPEELREFLSLCLDNSVAS